MALDSLDALLLHELKDLYSAEKQILKALPKKANAATSENLREGFEKPDSMIGGGYCKIDKYDRVARISVGTPSTVCGQFLKRRRDLIWIASDIDPHRFHDSRDHIANITSDDMTARIRDSLAPLRDISGSKGFPVLLQNAHPRFTLVDLFSATKCQRRVH